ncbi:hypothetical protein AJ79_04055 [Helicocarpus griseus UAMH5409]|uniref:Gag1-like clamp domain-containing protein n=1 Tax=Helicocarpus griseus UAMH5409 TaxID=1447875 RepID=A0A2B7XVP6_9EURO|nr:hypothetical protein AJ79_04055 [Helicocarpus griseus UAMH5409]
MDLTQPPHPPPSHAHPSTTSSVFASLHRKSRSTSAAANGASANTASETLETREAAIKSAKRYLLERIRDDWSYERRQGGLDALQEGGLQPVATTTTTTVDLNGAGATGPGSGSAVGSEEREKQVHVREVGEWREREMDSSCSETGGGAGGESAGGRSAGRKSATSPDPYRFESPEAVEDSLLERRRKRRKVEEEEVAWNEGLRIWIERRDAWTGARRRGNVIGIDNAAGRRSSDGSGGGSCPYGEDVEMVSPDDALAPAGHAIPSRPLSSSSAAKAAQQYIPASAQSPSSNRPSSGGSLPADPTTAQTTPPPLNPNPDASEPLIPLLDPLLPSTNPIRASIKPSIYPSIYSKVIIQSLTPAIPINLSDVTRALVQGWKADGEWPPRPTVTQDVPVIKKRFGAGGNTNPSGTAAAAADGAGKMRRLSGSGVTGAVKKVLGLSGIHAGRRFHLRGSSQSVGPGPAGAAGSPPASGVAGAH